MSDVSHAHEKRGNAQAVWSHNHVLRSQILSATKKSLNSSFFFSRPKTLYHTRLLVMTVRLKQLAGCLNFIFYLRQMRLSGR